MKKFITLRNLLLVAFLSLGSLFGWAQTDVSKKLSAGTKSFISVRNKNLSPTLAARDKASRSQVTAKRSGAIGNTPWNNTMEKQVGVSAERLEEDGSPLASAVDIDGVQMIQAFITLTDEAYAELEAKGVRIDAKLKGKITAMIPVDSIESVAALKAVKRISVAKMLQEKTYYARIKTNVDDVIYNSSDAQTAGLLKAYDGTGVVLGIIDTGIQFSHQMFKDANGDTRIVKAYVYNTTSKSLVEYTGSSISSLTYDISTEDHGSHTSSIAGGSDFEFSGYYYDNDEATYKNGTRTYGGMAPKTDLVLCGLAGQLTDANITACIQNITEYAKTVGKPCVISISLGSQYGPHDGTGDMADVCKAAADDGAVILYAASNDGGENIYLGGTASKTSPIMSTLDCTYSSNYVYGGAITYARTPNVELAARFYVVNTSTNAIVWMSNEITSDTEISASTNGAYGGALSTYFKAYQSGTGYLCAYFDQDANNNKYNIQTVVYYFTAVSSNYKFGVSYYPKNSGVSTYLDTWGLNYTYFDAATATYSGTTYNFVAGTDKCSVSDEATFASVIPIGAYTSGKGYVASDGYVYTNYDDVDDVASFSSWQATGTGPLGTNLPWISAPGHSIIAAYNTGDVSNQASYLNYGYDSSNPIGAMSGTSMATPCAAGIVALWLQAATEMGKKLSVDDVKTIMAETAIKDSYTSGTNAQQFGPNGKIDALAGIEYILASSTDPVITANPTSVSLTAGLDKEATQTVTVSGRNLIENVSATLTDANNVFSVDKTSVDVSSGSVDLTITFKSAAEGTFTGTLLLASAGAESVAVSLSATANDGGKASDAYLNIAKYKTIDDAGWSSTYVNTLYKYTEYKSDGVAWLTLPVYGAWVGVYYNSHPQTWIQSDLTTSNSYAGKTWTYTATSTNPYLGSGSYFTGTSGSGSARVMGYNGRTNTTKKEVDFYVTNITAVKALGIGASGASSTYPAAIKVYECTENSDGTLTASTTAAKSSTSTSTSTTSTFTLSCTDLDASKIYKVEASVYRGYIYEIGFQTSLEVDPELSATPTSLTFDEIEAGETTEKTFTVNGLNLKGNVTLSVDNDAFSLNSETITAAEAQAGKTVAVTFAPTAEGTYTGSVTLKSDGVDDVTVALNATATKAYPATFDVTVNQYGVSTLYLDFPVEIPYEDDDLLGVYYAKSVTSEEIKLARLPQYIPANTGVIVQGNAKTYTFRKTSDEVPALIYTNYLTGTLEAKTVADVLAEQPEGNIVLTLGRGSNGYIGFYKFSGNLPANKAFLIYDASAGVKSFNLTVEDEATGLNTIIQDGQTTGLWYTLQGARLVGAPAQRGIYIHDGKKVLVK